MTNQLNLFGDDLPKELNKEKPHSRCCKCGDSFVKSSLGHIYCKPCQRAYKAELYVLRKKHPYPDLDHCCSVCGTSGHDLRSDFGKGGCRKTVWRLDHDHITGEFRGFLCHTCNIGLGKFKDDPAIMLRAIAYLKTNNGIAEMSEQQLADWCYNTLSRVEDYNVKEATNLHPRTSAEEGGLPSVNTND